eukprot:SAG11_NODE_1150_length_5676_cov_6.477855_1_plen_86_part_00
MHSQSLLRRCRTHRLCIAAQAKAAAKLSKEQAEAERVQREVDETRAAAAAAAERDQSAAARATTGMHTPLLRRIWAEAVGELSRN